MSAFKDLLGKLPFTVETYWALRGQNKPWSAHYELEDLNGVLQQAVGDVLKFQRKEQKKSVWLTKFLV